VSDKTRVGIIGTGLISRAYATKVRTFPHLDLVACADIVAERAVELASEHEIPKVLDVEQLLADPDVDVVVNLTIPAAHVDVSAAAIASGKGVWSEKPLALDRDGAASLVRDAAGRGVRIGCAPDTFMGAGLQLCRKLIDEGAIGEPVAASAFMLQPGPERWHPRPEIFYQYGGGPVFDMGPYYVTALVALLGPVARVSGAARITHPKRTITAPSRAGEQIGVEVPTHVAGVLEMASGPVATMVMSFDVQTSRLRNIEVYGTEGTLAVPDPNTFGGPVQIRRAGEREWTEVPLVHGHAGQSRGIGLADMAWAMRTGRPHRASGELASHAVDVMQSLIESGQKGRRLKLKTTCERPAPIPPGLPEDAFDD
jgi:predicted dehydrogenase